MNDPSASAQADSPADPPSEASAAALAEAEAKLYQLDPDEFMARRKDLAASAREVGQTAVAKQIAALRKPTRSAWVVNRLVRAEPEVRQRLTDLAAELRDAERAMDGARIRELSAARRRLVDDLAAQALASLKAPSFALREEVMATFDAAVADPDIAASLGTLVRAAHWAGFGLASAPDGAPSPDTPPSPQPPAKKPKTPEPAEAGAERDRRRREKIQLAERVVVEATQAADAASAAEQALEDTVRRLETELAEARQRLVETRRQSYRAESRRRRAAGELGRLSE
jgi:hypothetical protein